jgi:CelD/BcsL family acetyltransferase involved in cellulose biosynthesis
VVALLEDAMTGTFTQFAALAQTAADELLAHLARERPEDAGMIAQAVAEGDALLTIGLTIGNDAAAVELLLRRKGSTMAVCAVPLRIREATRT